MRLIGSLWMTVVLLIAPVDAAVSDGASSWYLLEPPVDETSNVAFGILAQAPLNQWKRVRHMTLRPRVSTNEMTRSKRAAMKHYVCRRHRRCRSWRSSKELTAIVALRSRVSASLQMTPG
jgi:hypothetical protein